MESSSSVLFCQVSLTREGGILCSRKISCLNSAIEMLVGIVRENRCCGSASVKWILGALYCVVVIGWGI